MKKKFDIRYQFAEAKSKEEAIKEKKKELKQFKHLKPKILKVTKLKKQSLAGFKPTKNKYFYEVKIKFEIP